MSDLTTFPLPTDTVHIRIEARQYKLFNIDLGEGIVRRKIGVGAAIVVPYWLILAKVLGLSLLWHQGQGGFIYFFPAGIMVYLALKADVGGRAQYVVWLDKARFLIRRNRPMIASPISRGAPGRAFVVSARLSIVDINSSRRLKKTLKNIEVMNAAGFNLTAA